MRRISLISASVKVTFFLLFAAAAAAAAAEVSSTSESSSAVRPTRPDTGTSVADAVAVPEAEERPLRDVAEDMEGEGDSVEVEEEAGEDAEP